MRTHLKSLDFWLPELALGFPAFGIVALTWTVPDGDGPEIQRLDFSQTAEQIAALGSNGI